MKTCRICGLNKPNAEFGKKGCSPSGKQRYESRCKACRRALHTTPDYRAKRREYYRNNSEAVKARVRKSYLRRREEVLAQKAAYRETNRQIISARKKADYYADHEISKKKLRQSYAKHAENRRRDRRLYVKNNPEKARLSEKRVREKRYESGKAQAYRRRYYLEHKEEFLKYERQYRKNSKLRNISSKIRNRINGALRYNRKSAPTEKLIGCTFDELIAHLENKFTSGMTWKDFMAGHIHIDHIRPCAGFDLTDPEEQRRCFNFRNLQPLWAKDNLRKHAKRIRT